MPTTHGVRNEPPHHRLAGARSRDAQGESANKFALNGLTWALVLGTVAVCACRAPQVGSTESPGSTRLEPYQCGNVQRLHTLDGVYLASQPAAADFEQAAENGIRTILNLRENEEVTAFDEPALIAKLKMNYVSLPFKGPGELSNDILDRARALLRDRDQRPMLVHCSSGNRVGAIWLAHRVLDAGLSWEAALEEARTVGLKVPALEARVKAYCDRARVGSL